MTLLHWDINSNFHRASRYVSGHEDIIRVYVSVTCTIRRTLDRSRHAPSDRSLAAPKGSASLRIAVMQIRDTDPAPDRAEMECSRQEGYNNGDGPHSAHGRLRFSMDGDEPDAGLYFSSIFNIR